MPDEVERHLLDGFAQGDHQAFEALFRQFEADVFRWILRIVRDRAAAEDALVETFWRAYRSRARFDPARSFGAWLRRIATNAAFDALRLSRRRNESATVDDRWPAPNTATSDRGLHEALARAFAGLPPKLRVAATLALIEGVPYAEIADALEVPIGTVKSRVSRATEMLKQQLTRMGITL
jgi:RNA polymerase sigma-70 factor, ECF subfamily